MAPLQQLRFIEYTANLFIRSFLCSASSSKPGATYIHPLKPPPRRSRAREALLPKTADTDLVPSAPPPSPTTPNRSEADSKTFAPNMLLDVTEFGVCRLQSPLAMEDNSNLDEEHMLRDHSELWTHGWPTEQKNRAQLVEERFSDDVMETSEENESDDDMEVTGTANGRPSGYVMETKQ